MAKRRKPINSDAKGKRGERELASKLRELGLATRRSAQVDGGLTADLVGGFPGVHHECKREARAAIYKHVEQAVRDADGTNNVPAVFLRANRKPWVVIVRLEDLFQLAHLVVEATAAADVGCGVSCSERCQGGHTHEVGS